MDPLLVPLSAVTVAALKQAFGDYVAYLIEAFLYMRRRPWDENRDPDEPDKCQVFNDASGEWQDIYIYDYKFGLNRHKNGVYIAYPVYSKEEIIGYEMEKQADGSYEVVPIKTGGKYLGEATRRVPVREWKAMKKRHLPKNLGLNTDKGLLE